MKLSMEMRVFAAIFLCFIVLVVYQAKFAPPPPKPAAAATTASGTPAPASGAPSAVGAPQAEAAPAPPAAPTAKALVADTVARDVVVQTDAYIATFNTQGAVLKSYRLRHYSDAKGEPLELIPTDLPVGTFARPFTMSTDSEQESATLAAALYLPSAESLSLGSNPGTLTFEYRDESGLNARKTFYFQPKGQAYVLNVEGLVDVSGKPRAVTVAFGPGLGLGYSPDGQTLVAARGLQDPQWQRPAAHRERRAEAVAP